MSPLFQIAALVEGTTSVDELSQTPPISLKWLQLLGRSCLTYRDAELIQHIAPMIDTIPYKAGNIIDNKFSIVDQGQSTGGSVAEELVAEAAFDAGDDFIHAKLTFQACCRTTISWANDLSVTSIFTHPVLIATQCQPKHAKSTAFLPPRTLKYSAPRIPRT